MEKPADMVRAAVHTGRGTSAEGIPWIKEQYSYSMTPQVFGRLLSVLKKEKPSVELSSHRVLSREVQIAKKIELAKTLKQLLKDHLPAEIEEMLAVMAGVS